MANTTFDPGSVSNATLSGGDLTVSHDNTSTGGVNSSEQKDSGKYYFEITVTTIVGNQSCVGVMIAAGTYSNFATGGADGSMVLKGGAGGVIWANGLFTGYALGTLVDGEVIGVAVDLDNEMIWFRKSPSGNWNGDGSADPASNVNGVDISPYFATTLSPTIAFAGAGTDATEVFTANFGDTGFSGTAPAGFTSGWPETAPPAFTGGASALLAGL